MHKMVNKNLIIICFVGMFLISFVSAGNFKWNDEELNCTENCTIPPITFENGTFYHTSGLESTFGIIIDGVEYATQDYYTEGKLMKNKISYGVVYNLSNSPQIRNAISKLDYFYYDVVLPVDAYGIENYDGDGNFTGYDLDFRKYKETISKQFSTKVIYEYYIFSDLKIKDIAANNYSVTRLNDSFVRKECDNMSGDCWNITRQKYRIKVSNFDKTELVNRLKDRDYLELDFDPSISDRDFITTITAGFFNNTNITNGNVQFNATGFTNNGSFKRVVEIIDYSPVNSSGLVGNWILKNTDATDESSNSNNGTFNGGLSACNNANERGFYCDFDGVNDWINVSDTSQLDITGALTLSAWVYFDDLGGATDSGIVCKYQGAGGFSNQRSYCLGTREINDDLIFIISSDGTGGTAFTLQTANTVSAGEWIHIVATYEPSTRMSIYQNGVLTDTTVSTPASIYSGTAPLTIGHMFDLGGAGRFHDGRIQNVQIYNRSLSAQEVMDNFNPVPTGFVHNMSWSYQDKEPRLTMHFDRDSQTQVDSSGFGNDGTVTGAIFNSSGYFDGAYEFDGANDWIDMGTDASLNITDSITYETWFKTDAIGQFHTMMSKGDDFVAFSGVTLWFDSTTTIKFSINTFNVGFASFTSGSSLADSQWHHVVGTYNSTSNEIIVYVDGVAGTPVVYAPGILSRPTQLFALGRNGDNSAVYYDGLLDEVNVYPRALSPAEILAHNNSNRPSDFLVNKTNIDMNIEYATDLLTNLMSNSSSIVGGWNMNQNDSGAGGVTDFSGNSNDGSINGNPVWNNGSACFADRLGCWDFDGTDYIDVGDLDIVNEESFAVCAWSKGTNTGNDALFVEGTPAHFSNRNLFIIYESTGGNVYQVYFRDDAFGGANIILQGTSNVNDGNWHQVCYNQITKSSRELWVDGVLEDTNTTTVGTFASTYTYLGAMLDGGSSPTQQLNGFIDSVQIYNRSLSQDEITENFFRYNFTSSDSNNPLTNQTFSSLDGTVNASAVRYNALMTTTNTSFTPTLEFVNFFFNSTSSIIPDSTPPTFSNIAHDNTKSTLPTKFSVLWNNTLLHPRGQYIFSTNNTGTWTNDSAVNFTTTPSWANVTKTLNSTVGIVIGYRWYATDNAGNMNDTGIQTLTTITADTPRIMYEWINVISNVVVESLDSFGNLWLLGNLNVTGVSTFQDNISVDGTINATGIITYDKIMSNAWIVHSSEEDVLNFTITGATISGNLTTINKTDGDILTITEGPGNPWNFNFTCSGFDGSKPSSIKINGWEYIGNHNVKLRCFNGTADEDITSDADDFPQLGFTTDTNFPLMNNRSRFVNASGSINCNVNHDPNGAGNHFWSADSIKCESANIELDTPGEFVTVTNYDNQITQNINFNLTTGVWNIIHPGLYDFSYTHSFSGTVSATYEMNVFINDIIQLNSGATRTLNPHGDIGNMGNSGATILNLSQGDNVSLKIDCGVDECYVSSDEILVKLERD